MMRLMDLKNSIGQIIASFYWDIGVDLGTTNTVMYIKDRGIVIDEPTMIARIRKKRWTGLSAPKGKKNIPIAYGAKAREMLDREPQQIEVVSPLRDGIVSDMEALQSLVGYYLKLAYEVPGKDFKILKPRVVVSVPRSITEVQKRAVKSIFLSAGAGEVVLIEGLVLAALGVGMPMEQSQGVFLVDIGGGKTEAGILSMGGVVVGKGIKTSGDDFDRAIGNFLKMKYGILIGRVTEERIKMEIGTVDEGEGKTTIVRGRDLETGLPKSIKVSGGEIREAMTLEVNKIVKLVKEILDETPPELMDDVLKRGIFLCGNGSRIRGIDKLMERDIRVGVMRVDDPGFLVCKGLGDVVQNRDLLERVRMVTGVGK